MKLLKRTIRIACAIALCALIVLRATTGYAESSAELQLRLDEAKAKLEELGNQVVQASEELYETEYSINDLNGQIEAANNEVNGKRVELDSAKQLLAAHVRSMYKEGKSSTILLLFEENGLEALSTYPYYAEKILEQDAQIINDVESAQQALDEQVRKLEEMKTQQEELRTQQQTQVEALRVAESEQQTFVDSLDSELQTQLAVEAAQELLRQRAAAGDAQAQVALAEQTGNSVDVIRNLPAGASVADVTGTAKSAMTTEQRTTLINAAISQLGVPYVIGGEQPGVGLDCSGFVQYCYHQIGIDLPHSAAAQSLVAQSSSIENLQPGDLIFWIGTADPRVTGNHVAMYIGNGNIIHAVWDGVKIQSLYGNYTKFGVIV